MRSSPKGSAGETRRWPDRWIPPACGPKVGSSASSMPPPSSSIRGRAGISPSRRSSSAPASRSTASTSTSGESTSFCWPCSRRRSIRPPSSSGWRSQRRTIPSSACTASWSSTTGCAGHPTKAKPAPSDRAPWGWPNSPSSCSPTTPKRRPGSSPRSCPCSRRSSRRPPTPVSYEPGSSTARSWASCSR